MDFWISEWISGFQIGFLDFTVDFWISQWISGFQLGFLDFWISVWISADGVRDFFRDGPLGFFTIRGMQGVTDRNSLNWLFGVSCIVFTLSSCVSWGSGSIGVRSSM